VITVLPATAPRVLSYLAWAAVGIALSIAAITPFTIGPWVAIPAIAAGAGLLAARSTRNAGMAGLLAGPGTVALWVSYLNRDGPGTVCHATGSGQQCTDEWSPWPLLAVGLLFLVISGVISGLIFARQRRD
jgi:hypothetical protein